MIARSFHWINRHQIGLFFLLVITLSWAVWIPAALAKINGETSPLAPEGFIGGLARWTPGLVALILSALTLGRDGAARLLRPLKMWRVPVFWYIFALGFQMVLFFSAKWIDGLLGNTYQVSAPLAAVYGPRAALMAPVVVLFAIPGSFAEELGWRGFALPGLQKKANALWSSLVIAFFWGAWHIPLAIYFGTLEPNDFGGYFLSIMGFIPTALLYTWIYNNTRGSLLLVTLFHIGQQLYNNFLGELPTVTDDILLWIVAGTILAIEGGQRLSRREHNS